jgi:hypothetical protein
MSETHPPRRIVRSIGAVLAGMLAGIVLTIGTDVVLHTKIERKAKEKNKKISSSYGPNISLRKSETLNGDCDDPTNIVIIGRTAVCESC